MYKTNKKLTWQGRTLYCGQRAGATCAQHQFARATCAQHQFAPPVCPVCLLSGEITIGNYVHISAHTSLYGQFGIEMGNFSGVSTHCAIHSASDDIYGDYLIGPVLPKEVTNVTGGKVKLCDYSYIATGATVLPNVTIREGTIIGAKSLVLKSTEEWKIYFGIPAKVLKNRKKGLLKLAEELTKS